MTGFRLTVAGVWAVSLLATMAMLRSMGGGMPMPGGWTMSMMWMRMPGQSWAGAITMFLAMWTAMMVAMMLPSAYPMLRNFRRFRDPKGRLGRGAATVWMAAGYFTTWSVVGLVVYPLGVGWDESTMHSSALSAAVPLLTGAGLMLAGALQFSRWKAAGLAQCRDPRACCVIGRRVGIGPCFAHGLRRGLSCGVCCAGPMVAMLVLGAMNPWVMAGVGAIIALEKLAPDPGPVVRWSGALTILAGAVVMAGNGLH
jgi:predicted metal-binding membrane protein